MNILHISTSDVSGGAARAAYSLHRGLLELGHRSRMLVGYKHSDDPEIEGVWFNRGIIRRGIHHFLVGKLEEYTGMQNLIQPFKRTFLHHPWMREADVIQLHNIHGNFFSHTILPELTKRAPIVWTLHDMWPLSDHCAYPVLHGCSIWETGEGKCPSLFDYPPIRRDTGAYLWRRKKEIYEQSDITFAGPSRWMCEMAKTCPLTSHFPIVHIPYGIDSDIFHPMDRNAARKVLDIPADASVIMISALPNAPRKGLPYFLESLQYLQRKPRPWILVVGSRGLLAGAADGFSLREMGFMRSSSQLNRCLGACDIFVSPTLADNLPLSIQEALAAARPVVSFDVGGVPDLVRHMETGYLARYKDAKDLAHGMEMLLDDAVLREKMAKRCREIVLAEYSLRGQAEQYAKIYEHVSEKYSCNRQ